LQGSFSLMVFGWAQIIMDIQPLIALLTHDSNIHGFSHTYVGAILLALFSALTGKYLSELGLVILRISTKAEPIKISWLVTYTSAFIGTFSHVVLDSMMHGDMKPFYPFTDSNLMLGMISVADIYKYCTYSGLLGAILYYLIVFIIDKKKKAIN